MVNYDYNSKCNQRTPVRTTKEKEVLIMFIKLTDTFDHTVEKAIEIAKENNLDVVMERDGMHCTDDLWVVLKFQNAGFSYRISEINSKYDKKALQVEFHYTGE